MNKKELLLLLCSAVLLILSFPKLDQPFLAWIALIPLLYVLKDKSVYLTFSLGWLCGCFFHIGLIYWIVVVTITYGKLIYPLGILVMLLLAGYLSLYIGFSFALARFIEEKRTFTTTDVISCFTDTEFSQDRPAFTGLDCLNPPPLCLEG